MRTLARTTATARSRVHPAAVVLPLLVLLLAGCGSGADDVADGGVETYTILPADVLPAELVRVDPDVVRRKAIDAALLQDGLALEFTEPTDVDRLTISTGGSQMDWPATVDGNTVTLQVNPGNPVLAGRRYEVAGSVVDVGGNVTEVAFWFETAL